MSDTTRIIWGKWDCGQCATRGISAEPPPGERQAVCPGCGSPREQTEGEVPYLDNAIAPDGSVLNANVADTQEELAIAMAGPDWQCSACGGDNRARESVCRGCGAKPAPPPERPASAPRSALRPRAESAPPTVEKRAVDDADRFLKQAAVSSGVTVLLGGLLSVAFLCSVVCLGVWSYQTHEVPGHVQSMSWEHVLTRETFREGSAQAWQSDISGIPPVMPIDGAGGYSGEYNVRDCYQKHHHDRRYTCGTKRECHDATRRVQSGSHRSCSHSSNGNGSFTERCRTVADYRTEHFQKCEDVTKYCSEPIYKSWCTYSTYRWAGSGTEHTRGENPPEGTETLPWPTLEQGPVDRLTRTPSYSVTWSYGQPGSQASFVTRSIESEGEFMSWAVGEPAVVTERNLGTVTEIKHVRP